VKRELERLRKDIEKMSRQYTGFVLVVEEEEDGVYLWREEGVTLNKRELEQLGERFQCVLVIQKVQ